MALTRQQAEKTLHKAEHDIDVLEDKLAAAKKRRDYANDVLTNTIFIEAGHGQSWDYFDELHRENEE